MMTLRQITLLSLIYGILLSGCGHTDTKPLAPPALQTIQRLWTQEQAALRLTPTLTSPAARTLATGTPVHVTSAQDNWYLVSVADDLGGTGWIAVWSLTAQPPPPLPLSMSTSLVQQEQQLRNAEYADWRTARQQDSLHAYMRYVEKYMVVNEGLCTPEAIARIEELLWPLVQQENTFEDYVRYLELFPSGAYADEARRNFAALVSRQRRAVADFWESLQPLRQINLSARREVIETLRQQGQRATCPHMSDI